MGTRDKSNVGNMLTVADVERNPLDATQARGPYEAPIARHGSEQNGLCLRGSERPLRVLGKSIIEGAPAGSTDALRPQGWRERVRVPYRKSFGEQRSSSRTGRTRPRRVRKVGSCSSTSTWKSGEKGPTSGVRPVQHDRGWCCQFVSSLQSLG